MTIQEILNSNDLSLKKALFQFSIKDDNKTILLKFNLWARYFFVKYFMDGDRIIPDANFHKEIDEANIDCYKGNLNAFVNVAYRGSAKTTRTKLFLAFTIANDRELFRRYIKVLTKDLKNSNQMVTDIYNMLVKPSVNQMYPEIFLKTVYKKEETMSSFTTATGIKLSAGTVSMSQRGNLQENARPDLIVLDDFETRETLRSAVNTNAIWDNMEEARTGLSVNGSCIYLCNYISEAGNVHKLITRTSEKKKVLITPIMKDSVILWLERHTMFDIEEMKNTDDDFQGERMCNPASSKDVLFDRDILNGMETREPVKEIAGFKIYKLYDPSHRYGSGHDIAGGLGLDSSTSVFIDFSLNPAQVVATFANNTIKPDVMGDEINRQANIFGNSITGIEKNNHGHATIARCRQLGTNLYQTQGKQIKIENSSPTEYGWQTNGLTKSKMLFDLKKAIEDGLLVVPDKDLVQELKSYSRNDLLDDEKDPRLTTRHFDILIALAIAYQMKDFADIKKDNEYIQEDYKPMYDDIGI